MANNEPRVDPLATTSDSLNSIQFNSAGNIRQKQVTKDEGMENIPGPDMIKVRIFTGQLHESAGR